MRYSDPEAYEDYLDDYGDELYEAKREKEAEADMERRGVLNRPAEETAADEGVAS